MVSTCGFGRQQQKNQIDGLIVDRLEVDGLCEPRKQAVQPIEIGELAMGDSDADANAGGAQALAFYQRVKDGPLVESGHLCGALGKLLQKLDMLV